MLSCIVMVLIFLFLQISIADEAVAALLAVNGVTYETGTLQAIFDFNSGSSADYTYDNLGMYVSDPVLWSTPLAFGFTVIITHQRSCGKLMSSVVSVCYSVCPQGVHYPAPLPSPYRDSPGHKLVQICSL